MNEDTMSKVLFIGLLVFLLSSTFVSADVCDVGDTRTALKKTLFEYFRDPNSGRIDKDEIRQLLNFYLSLSQSTGQVSCDPSISAIVNDNKDLAVTIPTCRDGTPYGECSQDFKPRYCMAGKLIPRCKLCGCAAGQGCNAQDGSCGRYATQTTAPMVTTTQPCDGFCVASPGECTATCSGGYCASSGCSSPIGGCCCRCPTNTTIVPNVTTTTTTTTIPEEAGTIYEIFPYLADVDTCVDASGITHPAYGEDATARWFIWNSCAREKQYNVNPGEQLTFRFSNDASSCHYPNIDVYEMEGGNWVHKQNIDTPDTIRYQTYRFYTPQSDKVKVVSSGCFYFQMQSPSPVSGAPMSVTPTPAQEVLPYMSDVETCVDNKGITHFAYGPEATARWFVWNGCSLEKEYVINTGEDLVWRVHTDSASCTYPNFKVYYKSGESWIHRKTYDFPDGPQQTFLDNGIDRYGTMKIVATDGCFYMKLFQDNPAPHPVVTTTTTLPSNTTCEPFWCFDTDGLDYYYKGVVYVNNTCTNGTVYWNDYYDYCIGSSLHEYKCGTDNTAKESIYTCPSGCVNGACAGSATTTTTTTLQPGCGDSICNLPETRDNCPSDCKSIRLTTSTIAEEEPKVGDGYVAFRNSSRQYYGEFQIIDLSTKETIKIPDVEEMYCTDGSGNLKTCDYAYDTYIDMYRIGKDMYGSKALWIANNYHYCPSPSGENHCDDVWYYDADTGDIGIAIGTNELSYDAKIYGNVVAGSYGNQKDTVVYKDLTTGQIKTVPISGFNCEIYKDAIVVWGVSSPKVYNITQGTTVATINGLYPKIWEHYVVYRVTPTGSHQLRLYDLLTGEDRVIYERSKVYLSFYFNIHNGIVVYSDDRYGDSDVFYYDISEGQEHPIERNPSAQFSPDIFGNTIVWVDKRNGNSDLYMANI